VPLQAVIDRQAGNALLLLIAGNGARIAESYNGRPDAAPLLHIAYRTSN
jgi:hypothetical protein